MSEIRFSGFGGQGVVRCSLITGKALSIYDNIHASMTQSFGPEARGGACSSQVVCSKERVAYPYVTVPDVVVAMSQDAYEKYKDNIKDDGVLIVDSDLVRLVPGKTKHKVYEVPATRFAEELGYKVTMNLIMLGFFTAVTGVVTPEAMKKALPGLVPDRFLDLNFKAFEKGYSYGLEKK